MRGIIVIALAGVLLVGCGGASNTAENTLRLGGKTYTESEYRQQVRADLSGVAEDPETEGFCRSLQGLSDDDAFMVIMGPSQISLPVTDQLRAAALYREECARFLDLQALGISP